MTLLFAYLALALAAVLVAASDHARLDQAVPNNIDILSIAPVFDFDSDGCLPAAGISRNGDQNGGQGASGSPTGACRSSNFLEQSNTVHRHACGTTGGTTYCGHFYALYFEKDQISEFGGGHRHDWEYAAIWTTNGTITHGSYSAHGELTTEPASNLAFENGHLKIVYHKESTLTVGSHAFRFASASEGAENPYGAFVTPTIISWYEMRGDNGLNAVALRLLLNIFNYGSSIIPVRNGNYHSNLNRGRPASYPEFTFGHIGASNTGPPLAVNALQNRGTGLCLDLLYGTLGNGVDILMYECVGTSNQVWAFDLEYNVIRSMVDPRWCLDHGNDYENGAIVKLWWCHYGHQQQYIKYDDGSIRTAGNQSFALDNEVHTGDVLLWWYWGGENQKWNLI